RRLQTDVIDLMQMHEINWDNDPEWVVEKGGLAELLKIQKEGKVRFVGFTGHKSPLIHAKMLPVHKWDTVQMPVNVCDHFYRSFVQTICPLAERQGTAVIGMKSLGGGKGKLVVDKVCTAEEAHRFALSQSVASVVMGMDSMDVLKKNIATARNFKKLEGEELQALLAKVKPQAGDGRHERFKSTIDFDGPYHRKQHGFEWETPVGIEPTSAGLQPAASPSGSSVDQCPRQESNLVRDLRTVACFRHTPRTVSIPTWIRTRAQTFGGSDASATPSGQREG